MEFDICIFWSWGFGISCWIFSILARAANSDALWVSKLFSSSRLEKINSFLIRENLDQMDLNLNEQDFDAEKEIETEFDHYYWISINLRVIIKESVPPHIVNWGSVMWTRWQRWVYDWIVSIFGYVTSWWSNLGRILFADFIPARSIN